MEDIIRSIAEMLAKNGIGSEYQTSGMGMPYLLIFPPLKPKWQHSLYIRDGLVHYVVHRGEKATKLRANPARTDTIKFELADPTCFDNLIKTIRNWHNLTKRQKRR